MYKRLSILALAFSLALALGGSPVQADLILNGSFENGVDINGSSDLVFAAINPMAIDDWNVFTGNLKYVGSLWWAQDGLRSLDLSGSAANGGIEQTFATSPGEVYQVSFWLAGNPVAQLPQYWEKTLNVKVGIFDQDFTFNVHNKTVDDMGWIEEVFLFTAQGGTSTLQFLSATGGSYGPALDNVSVTRVPLPASLLLLASGLLGLPFLGRRK